MEPMALGSPSGSPAVPYLPPFLMGESNNAPTTPRNNTLSPTKRSISFAQSPGPTSPQDFNRSSIGQKTLFGYQQTTSTSFNNYPGTPNQNQHNTSISGPPTQGLFDALRSEQNQVQTPTRNFGQNQSIQIGTPITTGAYQQSFNDSYLNSSNLNTSRITSPVPISHINANDYRSNQIKLNCESNLIANQQQQCVPQKYSDFWITVYGFPQSATSMILSHFSQCGTIVDKKFSPQNGNWIHLKFSSRLESDRALNYNEKILGNNIMIGVTHCKDSNIIDKENICENNQFSRVRSLTQVAYNSVQDESAVVTSPNAPQRSSGIVNKAMDILFGW